MRARDFLAVLTLLAELQTFSALMLFGQRIYKSYAGEYIEYNDTLIFFFGVGSACVFFLLAILIRFRSPLRWVLCTLLGFCLTFALALAIRYFDREQWRIRYQEPEQAGAILIALCCLVLHQAAFVAVWLLSPEKAAARNPQGAGQDGLGRQASGEPSQ